ncbi:MAG: DUF2442 domain-containing protein [Pseudomonadota bacterium]|nr:DUF2442 domain-containing protein [Pseudomonadota bacterium]
MFLIDVVHVKPLEGRKLELTFKDGLRAVVDMGAVLLKRRADGQAAFRKSWLAIRERWLRVCSWAL